VRSWRTQALRGREIKTQATLAAGHAQQSLQESLCVTQTLCRLSEGGYRELAEPSMAAEDFACYANAVPACFVFLGTRNESYGSVHPLHSAHFKLDPSVLPRGAAMLAQLALSFIQSRPESAQAR